MTRVFKSPSDSSTGTRLISQRSAISAEYAAFFITPGRTVDIQGLNRGQIIVAIRCPPKAGRVIFRFLSSMSIFTAAKSSVEDSSRNFL